MGLMPIQRTADHFLATRDALLEGLDVRSLEALIFLERKCEAGLLYNATELYDILKELKFVIWLKRHRYPGLHMVDGRKTSMQTILHNLWRNRLIEKFATGTFAASGRPTGVVWRIVRERENLRVVRSLQEEL